MKPEADESATEFEGKWKSVLLLTDWLPPAGMEQPAVLFSSTKREQFGIFIEVAWEL